jgi:hypothetical protein
MQAVNLLHKRFRMKAHEVAIILLSVFLGACSRKPFSDSRSWLIESYDHGVISVQHDGKTYKAACESSKSFNNAASISDPNFTRVFSTCETAIGLVGHRVQPLEGGQRDSDGRVVVMWNVGGILALRSSKDEHSPWRQEEFKVTSVIETPR